MKKNYWEDILIVLACIVIFLIWFICLFGDEYAYIIKYRRSMDENFHNKIECVWKDNQTSYLVYQGHKYPLVGYFSLFDVDENSEDDVLLSWNGIRYIGAIAEYYSYTSDNPIFIYEKGYGAVYFREDYDYTKDTFIIGDTDIEIAWKNIVASEMITIKEVYFNTDKVVLKSIQYPRIQMRIRLKCLDGEWLMILSDPSKPNDAATPSDEFLEILFKNGLINQ